MDADARVLKKKFYGDTYFSLDLHAPQLARTAEPGQFVMVQLPPGTEAILRRPMALARLIPPDGQKEEPEGFSLLVKIVGKGSGILGEMEPGRHLKILGPLGKGFTLPSKTIAREKSALLIAGGIGSAPLFFLMHRLAQIGMKVTFIYGGRGKEDLAGLDWIAEDRVELLLCTEDGSAGYHGMVTGLLDEYLEQKKSHIGPVYACGPDIMMEEVTKRIIPCGLDLEVSLEARMGCGLGVCLSCVVPVKHEEGSLRNRRICAEGPVFKGQEVFFNGH